MRRSLLFMPANNAGMLLNADFLGADAIILDLEDAVSPLEKDAARILARNAIKTLGYINSDIIVRINALDSPFILDDLREIAPLKPSLIMPPKIGTAEDVLKLDSILNKIEFKNSIERGSLKLIPLIETALGVENAFEIASASKRVSAVLLGAEDLTADMCCVRTKGGNEINYSRARVVSACRAASVDCFDTPFTDVDDDEGILADAKYARSLGFSGKAAISPRHVSVINEVFSPSAKEIEYSIEVMKTIKMAKAAGKGVVSLRGKMIDAPIVMRAERVLSDAHELGVNIDE
ncbi:MAG: aldolase/citrate lyase family protein [Clostridia bacterium]